MSIVANMPSISSICPIYTQTYVCMCRLLRTLNSVKDYNTLNLPLIPTSTNILLNLIWKNNVTWKTEIPGKHKCQGLLLNLQVG